MKKILTLAMALVVYCIANAQQPQWLVGSEYMNFLPPGSPPALSPSSVSPTFSTNAAYDATGNPLFTCTDGYIDLPAGRVQISDGGEVSIIKVPNRCNEWYVIGIREKTSGDNSYTLNHAVIQMINNRPELIGSIVNDGVVGYITSVPPCLHQFPGIAVSTINPTTNQRYLFTVGVTTSTTVTPIINRFIITGTNPLASFGSTTPVTINLPTPTPVTPPLSNYHGSAMTELELYESVSGAITLAWGDAPKPCTPNDYNNQKFGNLYTFDMASLAAANGTIRALDIKANAYITGIEIVGGRSLVYSISASPSSTSVTDNGVYTINIAVPGSPTYGDIKPIAQSVTYTSKIEQGIDGKYYVGSTASAPLFTVSPIDFVGNSINSSAGLSFNGSFSDLPDQVDNENYNVSNGATSGYELMAKDEVTDLGFQPNPSINAGSYFESPDLWNLKPNFSNPYQHQKPVYYTLPTTDDIVRFRIKNTGCATSPATYAKIFWSIDPAQIWPTSWVNGSTGKEITTAYTGLSTDNAGTPTTLPYAVGQGFPVPSLAPGEEYIISATWKPNDPLLLNPAYPKDAPIRLLGVISPTAQTPNTRADVVNFNNVVMRETSLIPPGTLAAFDTEQDKNLNGTEPYVPVPLNQDIAASPSLWNRVTNVPGQNDYANYCENPGHSTNQYRNVMRFKVKNIGTEVSAPSHGKLYWTLANTHELWNNNPYPSVSPENCWDGSKKFTDVNNPSILWDAGGELTEPYTGTAGSLLLTTGYGQGAIANPVSSYIPGQGFYIPSLEPGEEYVINAKWNPIDRAQITNDPIDIISICYLGRIVDPIHDPMYGEFTTDATHRFTANIKNNNNIVTRNSTLLAISNAQYKGSTIFFMSNPSQVPDHFNLSFAETAKAAIPMDQLGGFSVKLDDILWKKWMDGGLKGNGIEVNRETHEIMFTDFKNASLNDILLQPGEYRAITLSFSLKHSTDVVVQDYVYSVSQHLSDNPDEDLASECNFIVSINDIEMGHGEPLCDENPDDGGVIGVPAQPTIFKQGIDLSPNPSSDKATLNFELLQSATVSIKIVDPFGKDTETIIDSEYLKQGKQSITFSTADLGDGYYVVVINTDSEKMTLNLLVKH